MTEPAVSVRELVCRYPARKGAPGREAVRGVSFDVEPGSAFAILGPNGSGKSTVLSVLATLRAPSAGTARVLGLDVSGQAREVRRLIGVVFQNPSVDRKLSVMENMLCQAALHGLESAQALARSRQLLGRYGLAGRADQLVETLSGGLRRRLELAKSLLHGPRLLLLDEPSTGLDPAARQELWGHIEELLASGVTVVATTHLMEEAERCRRLALLDEGRLAALDAPESLKRMIGGDVLAVSSPEPEALAAALKERFGLEAQRVDSTLRLEIPSGHAFIPKLIEAFPGRVSSVSLGRPTLEDVFVHLTGRRFEARAGKRE